MKNWDIDGFGNDVRRTIQDAINTGDFSRLSRNISDTVDRAFGSSAPDIKLSQDHESNKGWGYHEENKAKRAKKSNYYEDIKLSKGATVPFVYKPVGSTNVLSIVAMVVGYGVCGAALLSGILSLVAMPITGFAAALVEMGALTVTALPFLGVGIYGNYLHNKCKRFKKYMSIIGNRSVCNIEELARGTGKKEKAIADDVSKLITQGWFCQGHLDQSRKSLMLTHSAYAEYKEIMANRTAHEERMAAEEIAKNERDAKDKERFEAMAPEIRDMVRQGEEYIRTIRRVNDEVPGEEVSNKMYKMEDLVRRIFKRVEEKPEQAGDLKRLMNYYLPTSIKLLEAYAEMDKQDLSGENIAKSKREIEETLDTLNIAYEKFLDDMFRDTAWDVSSDVSVLKTMLAREGLTDEKFKM